MGVQPLLLRRTPYRQGWDLDLNENGTADANFVLWSNTASGGTIGSVFSSSSLTDGNWHYLVAERSGGTVSLYQDGNLDNTNTVTGGTNSVQQSSQPVNFGDTVSGMFAGTTYIGQEDEVEISNVALSGGWITNRI